jgi:quercetin 2,3-dioxygenase
LDSEENDFIVKSENGARFVLIAGEPLGEPVVQHGPFVMNTAEEIQQAMLDYSMNQNGFEGASNFISIISQNPI